MAASSGVTEGTSVKLYWDATATPIDITSQTAVVGVVDSANQVQDVTDIGATENTINVIEYNTFGDIDVKKIAGMRNFGDFTVEFAIDHSDSVHVAIRDGDDRLEKTFVVAIETEAGSEATYAAVQGYVSSVGVANAVDGVATCSVTLTLSKPVEYHNDST